MLAAPHNCMLPAKQRAVRLAEESSSRVRLKAPAQPPAERPITPRRTLAPGVIRLRGRAAPQSRTVGSFRKALLGAAKEESFGV